MTNHTSGPRKINGLCSRKGNMRYGVSIETTMGRNGPPICGAGAAISASAKRLRCWSPSLAGSGCDCAMRCGGSGKHHGAAARHSSQMGSQSGLQGRRPGAAAVLGISPAAELSPPGSQTHTSNRLACHPCSNRVNATSRSAVYGPVCTVVWAGRSREAPPYPDQSLA